MLLGFLLLDDGRGCFVLGWGREERGLVLGLTFILDFIEEGDCLGWLLLLGHTGFVHLCMVVQYALFKVIIG